MLKIGKISPEGIKRIEAALMTILTDAVLSELYVKDSIAVANQFELTADEKSLLATRKRVALEEAGVNMRTFVGYGADVVRDNGTKITPDVAMCIPSKAKLFANSYEIHN